MCNAIAFLHIYFGRVSAKIMMLAKLTKGSCMKKLFLLICTDIIALMLLTGCFENRDKYMVIDLFSGEVSYMDAEPPGDWSDIYKTSKLVLRRIEPGTFTMGSPESELGRFPDETQHEVTITKPFYIGVFEITQKQYQLIAGYNPSDKRFMRDTKPVDRISYEDIRGRDKGASWPNNDEVDDYSFMGKLRARLKMNFDLPTEAQWEYACRAGTTTALNNGTNLSNAYYEDFNLNKLGRYAHNGGIVRERFTNKDEENGHTYVGSFQPNNWGIYDMHGNVFEWCLDYYSGSCYESVSDPKGPNGGIYRVLRGGGWGSYARYCRSADRNYRNPDAGFGSGGFRVALVQK